MILAFDPGPRASGVAVCDNDGKRCFAFSVGNPSDLSTRGARSLEAARDMGKLCAHLALSEMLMDWGTGNNTAYIEVPGYRGPRDRQDAGNVAATAGAIATALQVPRVLAVGVSEWKGNMKKEKMHDLILARWGDRLDLQALGKKARGDALDAAGLAGWAIWGSYT